jgi:tyrosine-protein phosphatase SIW14
MRWLAAGVAVVVAAVPVAFVKVRQTQHRNFRTVQDGVLYRSGQMPVASLDRVVREYGIRSVVAIREPGSKGDAVDLAEEAYCHSTGVVHRRILPAEWSSPDGTVPAADGVEQFLAWMRADDVPKPVLVHCFAGLHRTGAVVAAYRMRVNGWTPDEAIAEMKEIQPRRAGFQDDMLQYLRTFR